RDRFVEVDSVSGAVAGEDGHGLGPTFNANSCAACHAEPAIGGSSPHPTLGFAKVPNPQIAFASLDRLPGRNQTVPSFIQRDGPIARFGWKAQNKSLLIFSGEAYNVEQGVTSELFPSERAISSGCNLNPTPEDTTNLRTHGGSLTGTAAEMSGDPIGFAAFARFLAPPVPATASPSELRGARTFTAIGCAVCHTT